MRSGYRSATLTATAAPSEIPPTDRAFDPEMIEERDEVVGQGRDCQPSTSPRGRVSPWPRKSKAISRTPARAGRAERLVESPPRPCWNTNGRPCPSSTVVETQAVAVEAEA